MSSKQRIGGNRWTVSWRGLALVMALASVSVRARAQEVDGVQLRVTPDASGCVTEAALRARVASLGAQAKGAQGIAVVIDASVQPEVLQVRRNDVVIATRRFDDLPARCADRLQTLALVSALAIEHAMEPELEPADAELLEPAPAPEPSPASTDAPERPAEPTEPPAEPTEPAAESPEPSAEPRPAREPLVRTVVGLGGGYGLLPELAGLLALGVELPGAGLRIGLGALVTTEASTSLAAGTALSRLAAARAYGCAAGDALSLDLQACAGMTLGVVAAAGRDFASNEEATGTLLAPLVRLGARFPARGTFAVGLALEGFVHLVRPELQVSGHAGAVSSLPALGAALSLEGVLALP